MGRFPNPRQMMGELHALGFKVMLWVCPFVRADSAVFRELSKAEFLVIADEPKEELFWANTANDHTSLFAQIGLDFPFNELRATWKLGGQPIAQRLRDKRHLWEDLRLLIPGVIMQNLTGYPYSCPDMIGGGQYLSFLGAAEIDQELVVRWAQCSALMPMMQFSASPWRILSIQNAELCLSAAKLHESFGTRILELVRRASQTGEPIVRSLEYQYPKCGYEKISDQFLLGDNVLVAPMLLKNRTSRQVVIPPGVWISDLGEVITGPVEIEAQAPLTRLPHFIKKGRPGELYAV